MKRKNWLLVLLVVLAFGIWAAGCGDDEEDEETGGDQEQVEQTDQADQADQVDQVDQVDQSVDGDQDVVTEQEETVTDGDVTTEEEITDTTDEVTDTTTDVPAEEETPTQALCPEGQECMAISQTGVKGCVINQGGQPSIPPGNQTGCSQQNPCQGNFTCYCMDQNCQQTVCIENCGACPEGQECMAISQTGVMGCVINQGGQPSIPPGNQTGCSQQNPCQGNFTCYCMDQNCTQTVCIENCSAPH